MIVSNTNLQAFISKEQKSANDILKPPQMRLFSHKILITYVRYMNTAPKQKNKYINHKYIF